LNRAANGRGHKRLPRPNPIPTTQDDPS
jgi:hypothetical protein